MITIASDDTDGVRIEARISGMAAYLDTIAIINLATGSAERRAKLLDALRRGGSLLFSMANTAEPSRRTGMCGSSSGGDPPGC